MASNSCQCPRYRNGDEPGPSPYAGGIASGDVYTINESVCTPIYDILRNSPNLARTQWVQSTTSFISVCSRQTATKHLDGRPCIIMRPYKEPPTRAMGRKVCLATTLWGRQMSKLPKIFQEFSVPLYPRSSPFEEGDDHIHSLPQWSRTDAWIIAWEFTTHRPLIRRLSAGRESDQPGANMVLGMAAMEQLRADCKRNRQEWENKCRTNPRFAGPYAKEFFVSPR
ncbi:hypothetical protein K466DRAFT_496090 [Polyporus arcularius HHB13444]|uniref:Uncharacterized protein n=1 Tax=Polyporus arcularius HHB13444 TaxID=1314778 RepID=A0A5C3P716_9APHY|nr:hypothetical protein K466DRAFT_496090 [Polyporus arcularius HHB13444]